MVPATADPQAGRVCSSRWHVGQPNMASESRAYSGSNMELVTDRLVLRPPEESDADDALALLQDPEVIRWNPGGPAAIDRDAALGWCRSGADWSTGEHATWHGVDSGTGRLIVNISLFSIDPEHSSAKVGYRVVPWQRRQGYAREGLIAVTAWAFTELRLARIQLEHSVANLGSCRVALGAGYRLEGILRAAFRTPDGVRHDDHVHGRLSIDSCWATDGIPAGRR